MYIFIDDQYGNPGGITHCVPTHVLEYLYICHDLPFPNTLYCQNNVDL